MKKTNLYEIDNAYMQCFPEQGAEVKGELELIEAIKYTKSLIDQERSQSIELTLAVAYVKALGNHVCFLSSQGASFHGPTSNFQQVVQTFLLKHDQGTSNRREFKASEPRDVEVEKKQSSDARESSFSPGMSSRIPFPENKHPQKVEFKQAPVVVDHDLANRGAEFLRDAKNDLPALKKLGFFPETRNEANKMAYELLTKGYQNSPLIHNRQKQPPKNDFELAKQLQNEEIGRYFKR